MSQDTLSFVRKKIEELERELEHYRMMARILEEAGISQAQPQQQQWDLDSLPWRPYKDGGGEWIYRDEAPEDLVSQLITAGRPVRINGHIYSMKSGTTGKTFISRKAVK
jgi:hypothetical protein